jgi:hypothetical protein
MAKIALFLLILLVGLDRLCHTKTSSFSLNNISHTADNARWNTSPDDPGEILNQKYLFLGSGSQSYVFCSEDGQYILKLSKKLARVSPFSDICPQSPSEKSAETVRTL